MTPLFHERSLFLAFNGVCAILCFAGFCASLGGNPLVAPDTYGELVFAIEAEAWTGALAIGHFITAAGFHSRQRYKVQIGGTVCFVVYALFFGLASFGGQGKLVWAFAPTMVFIMGWILTQAFCRDQGQRE